MKNFSKTLLGLGVVFTIHSACEKEFVEPDLSVQSPPESSELILTRKESSTIDEEKIMKPVAKHQRKRACEGHSACNIKHQEEMHLPYLKKE